MNTQHPKSTCCRALTYRHGDRRRQCSSCLKTWSMSSHKRGRKKKRYSRDLLNRVVLNGQTAKQQNIHYAHLTIHAIHKRLQRLVKSFVNRPQSYPKLKGSYILLADGVWYKFNKQIWILYLLLLKPRKRNYAYLLDPVMLKGKEDYSNWNQVIQTIPSKIRKNIVVFVSDNFQASKRIVQQHNWKHQLCHFHLLKELKRRRGRRQKHTLTDYPIRESIYQNICCLLLSNNPIKRISSRQLLLKTLKHPACPYKMGMIVREFLRNADKYQAYLRYPEYTIPRTTGACESLARMIRQRTRTLKTPEAILQWATAFVRLRKTMTCNGIKKKKFPQN